MALISKDLLVQNLNEYLTLQQMTLNSDASCPSFGKWMSNKYAWQDKELESELNLDVCYSIIESKYVKKL